LEYIGSDNQKHRPVMIHRAPFGSMERFVAVLIEHTGGKFPLWLTPEQFIILPVSDKFLDKAQELKQQLENLDLRGSIDVRSEKIGRKIRDAELKKVPFMLVLGEKEMNEGTIAVRRQGAGDLGSMTPQAFAQLINEEIKQVM
jgi:threonyl-tRNA synthetase